MGISCLAKVPAITTRKAIVKVVLALFNAKSTIEVTTKHCSCKLLKTPPKLRERCGGNMVGSWQQDVAHGALFVGFIAA